MLDFLLDGGYAALLALHLGVLALLSAWGLARSLRGLGAAALATLVGLGLLSALIVFPAPARPAVYFDEFFYVAIGTNLATTGRAEPLLYEGAPPRVRQVGHFQPPYPQGWPFMLSLAVGPGEAPRAGVVEPAPWDRAVLLGRFLLAALPPLLFLGAVRRFPLPLAAAAALALLALPPVLHLAGSAASEIGSLFFLALSLVALEGLLREPSGPGLGWLALAAAAVAGMRPEGLVYVPAVLALGLPAIRLLPARVVAPWLVVAGALCLPPLLVMAGHDPSLAHHFEAAPRPGFTLWGNRLANLGNNGAFFLEGRIWPLPLTLLALAGLAGARRPGRRLAPLLAAAWIVGITLFLSWYPFGDYGAVHSLDTWRFAHHVALPMLALAALGALELARSRPGGVAAGLLLAGALAAPWTHGTFLAAPHRMEPLDELASVARQELQGGMVAVEQPEYFCYLRYRHGLPALLAPVAEVPEGGLLLFALDEGRGLPDRATWSRFEVVPLVVDEPLRAGLFEVRAAPGTEG